METPNQAARRLAAIAINAGFRPQALHEYTDATGIPIYWRIRLFNFEKGEKWIRPMKLNGVGYVLGEPVFEGGKPLYHLAELSNRPHDDVIVCEGEWCADALAEVGALATTSGGADSAGGADWSPLAGRSVTIWPDNDEAGLRYADAVQLRLKQLGCAIRVVDVGALGLPPKGDAVEWIESVGHDRTRRLDELPFVGARLLEVHQVAGIGEGAQADWPKPGPIEASLRAVPALDTEVMLPEGIRDWVLDEAERMPCPPDFVAAAALVALGSLVGARCAVRPKANDSWLVVPNLWGGIVGLPSAKKSPAIGVALRPLERLIEKAMASHKARTMEFETEKSIFDARRDAVESRIKAAAKAKKEGELRMTSRELHELRQQAPVAPTLRRYKTNDTTVEKLGELLRENPAGLLVMRDELVGLIAAWDREGREGERAFYLEAWNGNASFDTDRIGRGSIFVPNLCASIFGGIQPDKLTGYLEQAANTLANDGMLQRFQLLVYPDHCAWDWRDRAPNRAARDRVQKLFEALESLDPVSLGAFPADEFSKFPHFRFGSGAQEVFIEWTGELHRRRLPVEDNPLVSQHLAKYDKLFPALALVFHLVECVETGNGGEISAESAYRAAAWCEYLEQHARRCYGLLADDGFRSAQALAAKIRSGNLVDGFTARDVRRNQWKSLTTDDAVQAALDWLEDEAWLRAESSGGTGPGSGRRTWRYSINPAVGSTARSEVNHG